MSDKKVFRPEPKPVTTEYVRKSYAQSPVFYQDGRSVAHWQTPDDIEFAGRQFDAWLAAHDAEVIASAEPSSLKVRAAWKAFNDHGPVEFESMRDALRAAGAAPEGSVGT